MTNTAIAARRTFESDNGPLFDLADLGSVVVDHDAKRFGMPYSDSYSAAAFVEECDAAIDSIDWAFDCYGEA